MENLKRPWVRGSCIGRGSYGTVSLAVNKSDGQGKVFAVKSVDLSSCLKPEADALENEIRILRSLSSPWVVEYLGDDLTAEQGSTTSFRNLHLEYLPGGTVADLAKRYSGADVDEEIVRSYTWCVVSALKYVHAMGIVHCDVKGKNVLMGPTHGGAKLADFGSAAEISAASPPCGSPLWMAPEVLRREYQGRSRTCGRWGAQSSRWSPESRLGRTTAAIRFAKLGTPTSCRRSRLSYRNWVGTSSINVSGETEPSGGVAISCCATLSYRHQHRRIRLLTNRLVACSIG